MKLFEVHQFLTESPPSGTYVAVKLDQFSVDALTQYMVDNNIPNSLSPEKLHITILYSKDHAEGLNELGELDPMWPLTPQEFDLFPSSEEGTACLVVKIKSEQLHSRHQQILKDYNVNHSFPEYAPHITLSYNVPLTYDVSELPPLASVIPVLYACTEYTEPLDTDWSKK